MGKAKNEQIARILIVDDDPIVAESLGEFLSREGYETATAFNGEEALEKLGQAERESGPSQGARPFAVVLSDVAMPGIDGMELLRRVVKEHAGTVMLMLTGYGTIESAVQAVRLGQIVARDPSSQPSEGEGVCGAGVRVDPRDAFRERAVWACEGVVHGRAHGQGGEVFGGGRGDDFPGRDQLGVAWDAAQAAAGVAGAAV